MSCCFSADGHQLTGLCDATFPFWDTTSLTLVHSWRPKINGKKHTTVVFSPGGRYAAVVRGLLNTPGPCRPTETAPCRPARAFRRLFSQMTEKRLPAPTWASVAPFCLILRPPRWLRIRRRVLPRLQLFMRQCVAAAVHCNAIKVWDVKTGEEKTPLSSSDPPVTVLSASSAGVSLAGATWDGQVFLGRWNSTTCEASFEKSIKGCRGP